MADSQPTTIPTPKTLRIGEVHSLADRLEARGSSVIFRDQPAVATDMVTAAKTIRVMARSFNSGDLIRCNVRIDDGATDRNGGHKAIDKLRRHRRLLHREMNSIPGGKSRLLGCRFKPVGWVEPLRNRS